MVVDENELIRCIRQGDVTAMKMIFHGYYRALSLYALRYVVTLTDAEDLVQEVLISFWENKKGTSFTGSVRAYLFGAVQKSAITFIRKHHRLVFTDIADYPNLTVEEMDRYEEDEVLLRRQRIEQGIGELPEKCREIFLAIVYDNLKYKEVADRFDISVNTVKTQYLRALKQLRGSLTAVLMVLFFPKTGYIKSI